LRSADPAEPPSILFKHLADPQDVRDLVGGVRLARELNRQAAWDPFRGEEISPGADAVTDADLAAYLKRRTGTSYHPLGTCRMGPGDAVTDGEGRVKAVDGLRVVDASILPRNVTGNLNAAIIMVAEKISDQIRGRAPLAPSPAGYYRSSGTAVL
jgi:choline dehydrogenase